MSEEDVSSRHRSSSGSSSDDEFLLCSSGGDGIDREALVRKKLLESFYGPEATDDKDTMTNEAVEDTGNKSTIAGETDDDTENDMGVNINTVNTMTNTNLSKIPITLLSQIPAPQRATQADLDSPHFQAPLHTLTHIAHSSTHTLLETNERLALDIRTLDSTMQTLVYENYSKFIHATDAIKSIGINVNSTGSPSLERLQLAMDRIRTASHRSEQLLHASREAVAEKLRIQRLLTRLDALLCLPQTLRTYIHAGKGRMAVKAHKSATEILGRHSKGFESLRSIETECYQILNDLVNKWTNQLKYWAGDTHSGNDTSTDDAVLPPANMAQIFECAGTLLMLYETPLCPGMDRKSCQTLALQACGQYLKDRLQQTSLPKLSSSYLETANVQQVRDLLPMSFLEGILEATTLYSVSFRESTSNDRNHVILASDRELIGHFVTQNFHTFLTQVTHILTQLCDSFYAPTIHKRTNDEEGDFSDDANFLQISHSLVHLLRSVRELASALALPEIGLPVSVASRLVEQTVELIEMLVRKRVAIKFHGLRVVIVRECLLPLVDKVILLSSQKGGENKEPTTSHDSKREEDSTKRSLASTSLIEVIQLANVALSDGLQMADDLIRATLQHSGSSAVVLAPTDSMVVKLAVQKNARLLGVWLAACLERLVGCEPLEEDDVLLDIQDKEKEEGETNGRKRITIPQVEREEDYNLNHTSNHPLSRKDSSEQQCKEICKLELGSILRRIDEEILDESYSNFLLAVCEMCRLAERNIANTLNQSIQSAMKDDTRVTEMAVTLFATSTTLHRKGRDVLDCEQILAQRFKLAATRALAMYIMNRGGYAASELCANMSEMGDARDPYAIPSRPREECLRVFEIIKASCEDCITIVGGDLFVEPVAPFPEDQEYLAVFGTRMTQHSGGSTGGGASRGLQLDVERLFIDKNEIYPHSWDALEFTRNSILSGILRVTLAAFLECVRSSVFSSLGYRQLKIDALLLRYLLPHFVKDEFGTTEANACTSLFNTIDDILHMAGQRCVDHEIVADDDYYDAEKDEIVTPYYLLQQFLYVNNQNEENSSNVMKRISFS